MKPIGEVVLELAAGDWRGPVRRAVRLRRLQTAVRRVLADAGFGEIACRAGAEDDAAVLSVGPAAEVILRQMREELLVNLQKEFPEIKHIRFSRR